MIWTVQPFSVQAVTTNETVTSPAFPSASGRIVGFEYRLSTATTGTYVSATARLLVSADSLSGFITPVDSAAAVNNVLTFLINSNNRYFTYRYDDLPVSPWYQVQLISVTNQTVTFDSVRVIFDDAA